MDWEAFAPSKARALAAEGQGGPQGWHGPPHEENHPRLGLRLGDLQGSAVAGATCILSSSDHVVGECPGSWQVLAHMPSRNLTLAHTGPLPISRTVSEVPEPVLSLRRGCRTGSHPRGPGLKGRGLLFPGAPCRVLKVEEGLQLGGCSLRLAILTCCRSPSGAVIAQRYLCRGVALGYPRQLRGSGPACSFGLGNLLTWFLSVGL